MKKENLFIIAFLNVILISPGRLDFSNWPCVAAQGPFYFAISCDFKSFEIKSPIGISK